uniref:Ras GTPase-activating-like protein IQGAP1 n=1 Tax=Sinocyclocheilus rhinocerous TaxID=307959 RepID=A0A673KM10_9TELE
IGSAVAVLDGIERLTAEEMDERRQQNMAYEYLCHLEEAKRWIEACLNEDLPPTTELEEGLRNGVYLAKLGNFFAPNVVSLKKIYDREQTRYKATGLHFRHTDNIIQWLNAMTDKGLPKIFYPETTDIYDRKNMPRCIYCIHALSLYLFKLGLAPQITDLYGKVAFTEEEINNMKIELEKYNIQMPAFSKIGGILANELSVDEAALHAAVIAINDAIDHGVPEGTLAAMRNPNAMLLQLDESAAQQYQGTLFQAKTEKVANSRKRNAEAERDVYDELLTHAEIQGNINKVNCMHLSHVHLQLLCSSEADDRLQAQNKGWYLKQLLADREQKEQNAPGEPLMKEEIQSGVDAANAQALDYQKLLRAVERINAAIRKGVAEETVNELMNPDAQLPQVYPSAADLYQRELASLQQQSAEGSLSHPELLVAVEMLSSVVLINEALNVGDRAAVWKRLSSTLTGLKYYFKTHSWSYLACDFLTWNDIQACVDQVNSTIQEEHERIAAIGLINEALDEGDLQKTMAALQNPAAKLTDIDPSLAQHYYDILQEARREKAHVCIPIQTHNNNMAHTKPCLFSQAIQAINETVDNKDSSQTLAALRSPAAGLYGVTSECAQTYQDDLFRIKEDKKKEGDNGSEWMKHWVKGGHNYYYNLKTGQGTWEEPADFIPNNTELNKEEIQSVVSGVTTAYNREQLWLANESLIAKLQARCRGFLVRRGMKDRLGFLKSQEPSVTCIQVTLLWLPSLSIQSMVRMHQARKKYRDRLQYFKDHINDVVKIQAFIRANKARDDYKTLINADDPPMAVVRKFVHLLDHSDQDFQEELELMRLREEVITNIRSNQQLENDLNLMDIKIGLLVKNKITLQEVVSHSKKLTKKNKGELSNLMMMNKQKGGLKALSKEKREKLEAYQFLFYLLQTNPTYLAKLIFQMPQNKSTKFMDSVIFTLYNYASNQREEYLLLNLFKTALQEEIKSKVDHIQEIVTGNPTVIKMVVSFNRGARGQNALRQILAPVVKEIMDDKTLNIKTDPVDIYKSWVNQMESQTGEASKLPYDVTPEQAVSHEEVRTRLEASIKNMRTVTDKFLSAIIVSNHLGFPCRYGMRFIAKMLKDTLNERFPDATEDELLKIVGNLLYYRYMNPAIVAPDAFDIIDLSAGGQLTTEQRRNLGSIAKMLQHAASNKMFLGDNAHLNPINEYLSNSYQKFRRFFLSACDVSSLEDKFNVDQYSDLVTLTKPVIYISIGEIINTHTLLLDHQDAIAPDHNDPIHELLDDLGEVPTIESLIGESPLPPDDPNKEMMGKTEVSLTLTNKFDVPDKANAEMDAKTLLLNTKRLIVDVIRFQPGETLTEILETVASPEQEAEYQRAMQRRAIRDAKTPEKMKQAKPVVDDSLTLQGKKDKIKSNLQRLGELGKVHPEKKYQDLINDISKDIRNQRRYRQRRKAELVKLQQTNAALNSKTNFYNVQIDYYNQYIKTCMDNLASKVSKKPGDNKAKKSKQVSQKYTAARLHEKGVLIDIEDLQPNQYKNVIFEISQSEVVGVFDVKAKLMGVHLETLMLEYQDLLQLQYEGVAVMKLFDRATVNVNLLIFLLNKKFYGK